MKKSILSMALALVVTGSSVANAIDYPVRGAERNGGFAEDVTTKVQGFKKNRTRVVLSKYCKSSCTLYLALLPHGLVCATPDTKLIFHRFFVALYDEIRTDVRGQVASWGKIRPADEAVINKVWGLYPLKVRRAIMKHSAGYGLQMPGRELIIEAKGLVPPC